MVEKFDKKAAEKAIKDIKNNQINPYRDANEKGSKVNSMRKEALAEKADKGHKADLNIEAKAKEAGVKLDKDAMRRLEKIKTRYQTAAKKDEFKKYQSDQLHNTNKKEAEAFRSGAKAAAQKQRRDDYRGR
ncbi:MAG: hypothetical protein ACIPMY_01050 [Rickettsia endosymbiont of Pentastiridius leporinus]